MTDGLALLGRLMLSLLFVWGGYGKLLAAAGTQAYIAKAGLPLPELAWAAAVFVELVVGLALLFGLFTRLCGAVLAVWCLVTALIFHSDIGSREMTIQLLKNVGIAGGMLYVMVLGGGAYSLDALLSRRRAAVAV